MFSVSAKVAIRHACRGCSRHTTPAKKSKALVGTGSPGKMTNARNSHSGLSLKKSSASSRARRSSSTPIPDFQAKSDKQNPQNPTAKTTIAFALPLTEKSRIDPHTGSSSSPWQASQTICTITSGKAL